MKLFSLLSLTAFVCLASCANKPAVQPPPAPAASTATSSSPEYIIKDVQVSFEDADEPVPELHPVKPAAPKKKVKAQAGAKAGKAPSTSKAPVAQGAAVK